MELKFGHRVIAWDNDSNEKVKGRFVRKSAFSSLLPYCVLVDKFEDVSHFMHVELDPDATEFLRGDKVEFSQDGRAWRLGEYAYKSIFSSAHYDIDCNPWKHCRYPRKDQLHGKTAIIDGKEYELKLR